MTRYDLDVMNVNLMRKRYPYWYWGAMTMKTYGTKADYNFIHQANAPATGDSTFLPTLGCKNDGTGGYNSCFKGVIDGFRVLRGVWMDANGCII